MQRCKPLHGTSTSWTRFASSRRSANCTKVNAITDYDFITASSAIAICFGLSSGTREQHPASANGVHQAARTSTDFQQTQHPGGMQQKNTQQQILRIREGCTSETGKRFLSPNAITGIKFSSFTQRPRVPFTFMPHAPPGLEKAGKTTDLQPIDRRSLAPRSPLQVFFHDLRAQLQGIPSPVLRNVAVPQVPELFRTVCTATVS